MRRAIIVFFVFIWLILATSVLGIYWTKLPDNANEISFSDSLTSPSTLNATPYVKFPYTIKNTDLVIRGIYPYDGPFWEDGSGTEVTGVAAILIENTGSYGIDKARITVCQGKHLLKFNARTVPPGARVVVLEENMAGFSRESISYCFGSRMIQLNGWDISALNWKNVGIDELYIENSDNELLSNIRIYYNDYLQGMFIGGAANEYIIEEILPNQGITVSPDRYAGSTSRILCVLTD